MSHITDAMSKVGYVYNWDAYMQELKGSMVYFHSEDQFEKPMGGSKS